MGLKVTRKEGQRIRLTGTMKEGDEIFIETARDGSNRLKVYMEVPDTILILREELYSEEHSDPT